MNNRIAVIMCVYNRDNPEHLKIAIDSILNQTLKCDLLIYQDGPISENLNIILTDALSNDSVLLFKSDENLGLATGLNVLIDYTVNKLYEYVARMDADDYSHPTRLELQCKYLDSNQSIDVLGTSCHEFGSPFALNEKHLPECHDELINFSITRCPFIHPTVMFRMKIFQLGYRYPVNTVLTEDMSFWFELLNARFKFANINTILLDYRLCENTISRRSGIKKGLTELKIRVVNMFRLKKLSLKNTFLILARLFFHILPQKVMKAAYKYSR
ncbi:glycosyltransferase [Providencia sp. PROV174]|uniref:glycosyltransferase n=1 Tax=Providencia sp. PROV174 TaxID=2949877 RepID=UPI00234B9A18|nr:glycosyltransferase [Providencia sp. PROV174]